jgi:diacylglycerol kinase family enzyme
VLEQVFLNTATIGCTADVGRRTSSKLKRILGPAAFLLTGATLCYNPLEELKWLYVRHA